MVKKTTTLDQQANKEVCANYNSILPEPRDAEINDFLDSLDIDTFSLGMTKTGSSWTWLSDGEVVGWTNWSEMDIIGGEGQNCAVMIRRHKQGEPGHDSKAWDDITCDQINNTKTEEWPKSLICQKESMCRHIINILSHKSIRALLFFE